MDNNDSQSQSVGSSYHPRSSQSTREDDSDKIEPEDDFKFPFMFIIVMWSQIFKLLSKCQKVGCGASVLADNMHFVTNGNYMIYLCYQLQPTSDI